MLVSSWNEVPVKYGPNVPILNYRAITKSSDCYLELHKIVAEHNLHGTRGNT